MSANWTSTKAWAHGLVAAAITSFFTAAMGAVALPSVFTLDKSGFINMARLSAVPTMLAVFAYLKTSPLPVMSVTQTTTQSTTTELTKG